MFLSYRKEKLITFLIIKDLQYLSLMMDFLYIIIKHKKADIYCPFSKIIHNKSLEKFEKPVSLKHIANELSTLAAF